MMLDIRCSKLCTDHPGTEVRYMMERCPLCDAEEDIERAVDACTSIQRSRCNEITILYIGLVVMLGIVVLLAAL